MAKLRKDVRVELEGAQILLKGHPVTISISTALRSAGVDHKATLQALLMLSRHELRALEDRAMTPAELNVPKPDGYSDDRHADLCASFAKGIRSDRDARWQRVAIIVGIVTGLSGAILAWLRWGAA